MYIPFFTDYYNWCVAGKYWFSDKGCGAASVVGLICSVVTGLVVAPIKTLLDSLSYGYQATLTFLINAGAFFALSVPDHPHNFDPIDGIDLRQQHFLKQIPFGIIGFFSFLMKYLLFPLPIAEITKRRIGAVIGVIGVFILPVILPNLFLSGLLPLALGYMVVPAFLCANYILNKLSYAWIKCSYALDQLATFCSANIEYSKDFVDTHKVIKKIMKIAKKQAQSEKVFAILNDVQRQAIEETVNSVFKELNPQNLADLTTLSGRKKMVLIYEWVTLYACIKLFSIQTEQECSTFLAFKFFFAYVKNFNKVIIRNHSLDKVYQYDTKKIIFGENNYGNIFDGVNSFNIVKEKFNRWTNRTNQLVPADDFINQFKKNAPHDALKSLKI